ncbi:MAG: WG repeat-containing protein [Candidatus Obscuribacter sp.]|nr:WG repeat-containing protein [Candidatus Obscuribacter sp.]
MRNPELAKTFWALCSIAILVVASANPAWSAWGYIDEKQHKTVYPDHGYIDKAGKVILKSPHRTATDPFSNGLVKVESEDNTAPCYYIDKEGKVIAKGFKKAESFSENLAGAGNYSKMGFIEPTGKYVIAPFFQDVEPFREGLAPVMVNSKFGFVDKSGAFAVDPFFDGVSGFSEGLAAAESEGKIGFVDKTGTWKIKPQFDYVDGFSDGLALVWLDENECYIDKSGCVVIKLDQKRNKRAFETDAVSKTGLRVRCNTIFSWGFQQEFASTASFSEGLAAMAWDGKYGYIDKTGKFVVPAKFDGAFPFHDGIARVQDGQKYGFIDKTGSYLVEPKFLAAKNFSEGAAAVAVAHNKWGYIDKKGKFLITPKYSYAWPFSEGFAHVQFWGYFNDGIEKRAE